MQIKSLVVKNYKTYKELNLNLDVNDERSIILIGGENGGGKTTLFDAINASLYGLNIRDGREYLNLVNDSWQDKKSEQSIEFEILFSGYVLGMQKNYRLKRIYKLMNDQPVEHVQLDFDGDTFAYGTHTPKAEREDMELEVNRIIKANLPRELSEYFLFDALNIGELVKSDQINNLIKENIRSVMGFNKYQKLKDAAMRLVEEERAKRLNNDEQRREYSALLQERDRLKGELDDIDKELAKAQTYSVEQHDNYQRLQRGERDDNTLKEKIHRAQDILDNTLKGEQKYCERVKAFVPQLEHNIVIPHLAQLIAGEAQTILESRKKYDERNKGKLTDSQMEDLTREVVAIIEDEYLKRGQVDIMSVIEKLKSNHQDDDREHAEYSFLNDEDIKLLSELIGTRYSNPFPAIERERTSLNQSVADIKQLKDNMDDFRAQLAGDDYSLIKKYEENEDKLNQLKLDKVAKIHELSKVCNNIDQYDITEEENNDGNSDLLKVLPELFDDISARLLATRKTRIEQQMKDMLNKMVLAYEGMISRVELGINHGNISLKVFHKAGNEINLDQLNAASKQVIMQVLLKVLRDLGDYDPPVMIDSVMGNFDKGTRAAITDYYFPNLSNQTILLSNNIEITADESGIGKLRPYISKVYTLHRDKENQWTSVSEDYFEVKL